MAKASLRLRRGRTAPHRPRSTSSLVPPSSLPNPRFSAPPNHPPSRPPAHPPTHPPLTAGCLSRAAAGTRPPPLRRRRRRRLRAPRGGRRSCGCPTRTPSHRRCRRICNRHQGKRRHGSACRRRAGGRAGRGGTNVKGERKPAPALWSDHACTRASPSARALRPPPQIVCDPLASHSPPLHVQSS